MKKIKVGIVNYLNTAPLIYGLQKSNLLKDMQLMPDYPANLAKDLLAGEIDLGLVPVAVIPEMSEWHLVGDYCIGCTGKVASVGIFSQVPLEEVKYIWLDYQSRTSVELAKILLSEYWMLNVEFRVATQESFLHEISDNTAALVIGDRALRHRNKVKYVYDLGEAWIAYTGLPFVFAAWVSNRQLPAQFIREFNMANEYGLKNLPDVISQLNFPEVDLEAYFRENISYELDEPKKKGLERFLHTFVPHHNG